MSDEIKNSCKIYRGIAKICFKKIKSKGFSKDDAFAGYRNALKVSCKNQCDDYNVSKKKPNTKRTFICPVCNGHFVNLLNLESHQIDYHRDICKWRNRKW